MKCPDSPPKRLGNMTADQIHNKLMILDKRRLEIQKEFTSIVIEQNILTNELWWRLSQRIKKK